MADDSLAERERSGIYSIKNRVNGKSYIGSAKNFRKRWSVHKSLLSNVKHHSRHLQSSWDKHGESAFLFLIIHFCDPSDLLAEEQKYIDSYKPEYNVCQKAGSTLGKKHSLETKKKIADRALGRKFPPRSKEYRAAVSKRFSGRTLTLEHAAAFQAGRAKQVFTEERRRKVSESLKASYVNGVRNRIKTEAHKHNIGKFFAKLTDDDVRDIRRLRALGVTCKELAVKFNSNVGTICNISKKKRYCWVE